MAVDETRLALTPALRDLLDHLLTLPSPGLPSSLLARLQPVDVQSEVGVGGKDRGIGHDLVKQLGYWAQSSEGKDLLRSAQFDPGCYHPHSLLSTTHTLLPPSITRPPAQSSNPDIPTNSPFLPPSTQQPAEESFAQGWGKVGKQVGAVGNVLFSAGGVGGGVYWLGGHGHRWTHTKSVLLALFAFVAVAAVEIALYAIHFSRAESARKADELAKARWDRGGLTVVGKGIERVEVPFVQESEGGQEEEGEVVEMKEEVKKVELRRRPLLGRQKEEINQR